MSKPRILLIGWPDAENPEIVDDNPDDDDKKGAVYFIEKFAYDKLKAKHEEVLSYIPKVPTQPYEKQLAKEILKLRSVLTKVVDAFYSGGDSENAHAILEAEQILRVKND